MIGIRRAETHHRDAAARVLASAFSTDPLMRWMTRNPRDLERRLRPFYDATLRQQLRRSEHEVFVTEDMAGVAIWSGIDDWKMTPWETVRMTPRSLRTFRLPWRPLRVLRAIERTHPKEPHFYLAILGVHQDRQGEGVGSRVLAHMLDRCDGDGVPTFLEVSNPRNVPFYARHGYVAREPIEPGGGAPSVVPMWREPRTT